MNEEFARQVLRVVVGKVCQPLGVHGMHTSVCETLTDVLKTYLLTLGRTTASYSLHGKYKKKGGRDRYEKGRDRGGDGNYMNEGPVKTRFLCWVRIN